MSERPVVRAGRPVSTKLVAVLLLIPIMFAVVFVGWTLRKDYQEFRHIVTAAIPATPDRFQRGSFWWGPGNYGWSLSADLSTSMSREAYEAFLTEHGWSKNSPVGWKIGGAVVETYDFPRVNINATFEYDLDSFLALALLVFGSLPGLGAVLLREPLWSRVTVGAFFWVVFSVLPAPLGCGSTRDGFGGFLLSVLVCLAGPFALPYLAAPSTGRRFVIGLFTAVSSVALLTMIFNFAMCNGLNWFM